MDVVEGEKHRGGEILKNEEIPDVGAAVTAADRAVAGGVERTQVLFEALVLDHDLAFRGVGVPHAPVARREHAVEEVDSRPDGLEQIGRGPDPHQVARPVGGEKSRGKSRDRADRLFRLPDGHAANSVSRKVEVDDSRGGVASQVLVGPALHDAEEKSRALVSLPGTPGPRGGELARVLDLFALRGKGRTDVERHRQVHAEFGLQVHRPLGSQEMLRSVFRALKLDAVRRDLPAGGQAHDLKPSRVRQDRPGPSDERVKTAGPADDLDPRPHHEVVGVREHRAAVPLLEPVELDALDGAARPDWEKARRFDLAVRRREEARARGGGWIGREERKRRGHVGRLDGLRCSPRIRNGASRRARRLNPSGSSKKETCRPPSRRRRPH